jgi:ABC-type cobalamin transport system ATPase subunit
VSSVTSGGPAIADGEASITKELNSIFKAFTCKDNLLITVTHLSGGANKRRNIKQHTLQRHLN